MHYLLSAALFMVSAIITPNPTKMVEPEPIIFEQKVSDEDMYNLVMITLAEAEGESELGQRLVIDTVLNRVETEGFANNITDVIFAPNQFSGTGDRWEVVTYSTDIEKLVKEELKDRTNGQVLYFRTNHFPKYETPLFREGGHYFSGKKAEAIRVQPEAY